MTIVGYQQIPDFMASWDLIIQLIDVSNIFESPCRNYILYIDGHINRFIA